MDEKSLDKLGFKGRMLIFTARCHPQRGVSVFRPATAVPDDAEVL
ncbi:MAG: hypothetical protein WAM53_03470 [Terrimicrobiaceae bacterium]|jgi:hypothetical protein